MNEDKGWVGSMVQCDLCVYKWVAVYHIDIDKIECPNCGNMVNFENIKTS